MPKQQLQLPIGALNDHDSVMVDPNFMANGQNFRTLRDFVQTSPGTTLFADVPTIAGVTSTGIATGVFLSRGATGSQDVAHTLADTPVGVILFASRTHIPSGLSTYKIARSASQAIGFSDGSTESCLSYYILDAVTPTVAKGRYSNNVFSVVDFTGTVVLEGKVTALTTTKFTINWTVAEAFQWNIYYVLFGSCGGLVNAKVLDWTTATATGNQAVTGAGFAPQVALHLVSGHTAAGTNANARMNLGCMATNAGGHWSFATTAEDAVAVSNNARSQSGTSAYLDIGPNGAVRIQGDFVSFDLDGFTVNNTTVLNPGVKIGTLVLSGFTGVFCFSFNKPTAPAPRSRTVAGIGFNPTAVLNASALTIGTAPASEDNLKFCFGSAAYSVNLTSTATDHDHAQPDSAVQANDNQHSLMELVQSGFIDQSAYISSMSGNSVTWTWNNNNAKAEGIGFIAFLTPAATPSTTLGPPRNYLQGVVGPATPADQLLLWTQKKLFVYNASTGKFDIDSGEALTAPASNRFGIANTQGILAWSNGVDNIRQWTGAAYSNLVTSGTNHAAKVLLAFNNRIISVRPFFGGVDHKTQIRWPVNGGLNNWSGIGSGALEIIETSDLPLMGGFTLDERCYLLREQELIELIATGTLSPVFRPESRISGVGTIATYSVAKGEGFVFFLGADDVYKWDGSRLDAVGDNIYHTLTPFIDYTATDYIQGMVNSVDSEYWILIENANLAFIYDYRRDRWYRDTYSNLTTISLFHTGAQIPLDVDRSRFVAFGIRDGSTYRAGYDSTTYLGVPIDSFFETKDFNAIEGIKRTSGGITTFQATYDQYNSCYRVWFRSTPGAIVEVGVSNDRGVTYPILSSVTVNAAGIGIAFMVFPFSLIRIRLRNDSNSSNPFAIYDPLEMEFEESGVTLPP